jgi:hypothetical protein
MEVLFMLEFNETNWNECLEALGFTEGNNVSFGGKVIYDDNDIPQWTYDTNDIEYKKQLFLFFSGAVYWDLHKNKKD